MPKLETNVLYYGDNLDVLRKYIPDESIDLIYLDPPFNSNRSYNVLFKEATGGGSEAQIEAFGDTWHWGPSAQQAFEEVQVSAEQDAARMLRAMIEGVRHNDVTAYLSMMTIRLIELRRVLKPTGSLFLHCDPTAGPYLRVLMDAVFGATNFKNEIAWKRTTAHSDAQRFGAVHDTLLYYTMGSTYVWNRQFTEHDEDYVRTHYTNVDDDGRRYRLDNSTAAGAGPSRSFEGRVLEPPPGTHWRWSQENIDRLIHEGRIVFTRTGRPAYKRYLDEMGGTSLQDFWEDIPPINAMAKERLGYPTQKPLALLERIITASSNPGDVVLDPFCGCGTAVDASQKLDRRWIGIDITHLAIGLIRRRMQDRYPGIEIEVIGEPVDLGGATELAARDKYQFQWWVLDRLGAQPVSGKKKGSDKGIDGVIPFFEGPKTEFKRALVSVKGGEHVGVAMVRDLRGVMERENEPIGVLVMLTRPTKDMITEAAKAGSYENAMWKKKYPRIQLFTVEQVLAGKLPQTPPPHSPFAQAPVEKEQAEKPKLL